MNVQNTTSFSVPSISIFTSNPLSLVLLYRYGLGFIFLIGFTGNLASIITLMRPTLFATCTGCLFLILAVSDSVFLLVSIFDYVEVGLTQGPIFLTNYGSLCRLRWYLKGFIQFCSAWILVLIAIDRWLRTRFPFKANTWCTRRNAVLGVMLIIIISTGLHSHLLSAELFGELFPGIATAACGPAHPFSPYYLFFFSQWPLIQVFLFCFILAALMLMSSIDIQYVIRKMKNRIQPTGIPQPQQLRRERLQRQMLLLMISTIMIFFITTLHVNIRQIIGFYGSSADKIIDLNATIYQTAILTILLSFNYGINFYIHCLASKLFRHEFIQCVKSVYVSNRTMMLRAATNGIALVEIRPEQLRT